MSVNYETDLRESYTRYYRDTLKIPNWSNWVEKRLQLLDARRSLDRLENLYGTLDGRTIVDVGCGWGDTVVALAQRAPAANIVGIDPDPERVELAQRRCAALGLEHVRILTGTGESLPLPDGFADVACAYQVLEHVSSRPAVIDEVLRVLKPGGAFHAEMPNYALPREAHYKIFWLPFLPTLMKKGYLRLRGRPTGFLKYFDHTYPWQVGRLLARPDAEVREVQVDNLREKLRNPSGIRTPWKRALAGAIGSERGQPIVTVALRGYAWTRLSRLEYFVRKRSADGASLFR